MIRPVKVHVDNKRIIDGLRKGERKCIKPRAGDADLWIRIGEELHGLAERGIMVEVEHVKAHRTKKEKKHMSQFERFVTEGNEKADELAKAGAMLDEGFMAEARAETMQQERERGGVCSIAVCGQLPLPGNNGRTVKSSTPSRKVVCGNRQVSIYEMTKHRTEWCAETNRYRCMRCGESSKPMMMPGKFTGPKFLSKSLENGEDDIWEAMTW